MQTPDILREGRATWKLAVPLMAGQVCQMLIGLCDTLMIGRLGVIPLAASTFANTVLYLPLMFGIGMTMAVAIRVSQARGAKDPGAGRAALRHGLYLALGIGVLTVVAAVAILPFLPVFRQEAEVIAAVPVYFVLVAVSTIAANGAMAVKNFADALGRPWPAFWIMLGGVGLNVVLNWIFIFGELGAPAMGLEGAGLATLLARVLTLAGLILWCLRVPSLREWVPYHWFRAPDWPAVRSLVKVGLPASLQLLTEVSAFVAATMVIGTLGAAALASHQVAIQCAATVFMVPLGLSMALTVRCGEAFGAGEPERLRPIVAGGWIMGAAFTVVSAQVFFFGNRAIAGMFLDEPEALAVAAGLIAVAAVFQLSDAIQILSAGALRGLDDVVVPARIAFLAYWVIALPIGWVLAFPLGMGASGMWWGLTVGLTITAVSLSWRLWGKTGAPRAVEPGVLSAES